MLLLRLPSETQRCGEDDCELQNDLTLDELYYQNANTDWLILILPQPNSGVDERTSDTGHVV